MTKLTKEQRKTNLLLVKVLEDLSIEDAKKVMSDPNIDNSELNKVLEDSIMGNFVDKTDKTPVKLSNEVTMAGLRNILNRVIEKRNNETKSL